MRILGLETSSLHGSLAAVEAGKIVLEKTLTRDLRTAQSLAPAMKRLLEEVNWHAADLDAVAVTVGPGSFTGLRIGVTTAKTFAYAVEAKLIGVNTLTALAVAAVESLAVDEAIMPLVDAHRNQLFTARYTKQADGTMLRETDVYLLDIDPWLADSPPDALLTGPALRKLSHEVKQHWPTARLCEEALWTPTAAAVGLIAQRKAADNQFADPFRLLPRYYRPSYAEEKKPGK